MTKNVEFEILARDKSGRAVEAAARGFEHAGDKADEAKRQFTQLERETGQLRNKMLQTAAAAKVLGHEFAKTGDSKVLRDFEKMTREADRLGRVLKKIEPPKLDVKPGDGKSQARDMFGGLISESWAAGKLAGDLSVKGLMESFKELPAEAKLGIAGGLVTAAAAAAPLIIGVVAGAVTAGIGLGGIAAGLKLAAKDPAVVEVYAGLGARIGAQLKDAALPFKSDLLNAAPQLEAAFSREQPRIKSIFATLSTVVGPLIGDVVEAVHRLMPGVQAVTTAAVPLLRELGGQLPAMGTAVSNLFQAFARAGPGATVLLVALVKEVGQLIDAFSAATIAATPVLDAIAEFGSLTGLAGGQVSVLTDHTDKSAQQASLAAQDYNLLAQSMGNTANQARALDDSFNLLFGSAMNLDQANLAVKVGYTNLRDAIKENGRTLDDSKAKGQANEAAILSQVQALDAKRQAEIAAGNGTVEATNKANAAYSANVQALRGVLLSLGLTAAAVDNLLNKYAQIPHTITTTVTTVYRTDGTPAAGHSHDLPGQTGALASWAPARFSESRRAAMSGGESGTYRTGGPVQVHSTLENRIYLDGRPFRDYTDGAIAFSERRQAWRAKVGKR